MKNYWSFAIAVSFFIHSIVVLGNFPAIFTQNTALKKIKESKEIKVTLQRNKKPEKTRKAVEQWGKDFEQKDTLPPPYVDNLMKKLIDLKENSISIDKQSTVEKDTKEITIADIKQNDILKKNPSYGSYCNGFRGRLKKIADRYYDGRENGEVRLAIIVLQDGNLKYVECYGNKQTIKDLALKIVNAAAPFPPFPEKLKYPSLEFDISIEFKKK